MIDFQIVHDSQTGDDSVAVPLAGAALLECPMFNKGSNFSEQEREEFGLLGLLPAHVSTPQEQLDRVYRELQRKSSDLERHIFLRALQDRNETLFYLFLQAHIAETMPLVYTPTVGTACQHFSHIYRRARGLFIAYPQRGKIDTLLDHRPYHAVDVIVVTDGERILGLGDLGVGGMGIPVGKLSLYTLCGGIHPARTLPVLLDVGTDNPERLRDPLYLGWRHPRVRGQEYDDFVEAFIQAVTRKLPQVLLQWEDFAQGNALRLLERYRERLCTFNDDIQGTAAVTLGTLLAAVKVTGTRLRDQQIAVLGAGSAGCGISEQLCTALVREGLSEAEARARFWLIDRPGLLREGLTNLQPFQSRFVQPRQRLAGWQLQQPDTIDLLDVVRNVRPTILIGVSGQPGMFTEEIVREMARHTPRPIIFPLSNPTSRSEAVPADLIAWTEGRAVIATGSPFADVTYQGRAIAIAQCNNSYVFPALGLGILATKARRVTDAMILAAADALAACSPARADAHAPLLPPLADIRRVSLQIAVAVAAAAQRDGVAEPTATEELQRLVAANRWMPRYPRLTRSRLASN